MQQRVVYELRAGVLSVSFHTTAGESVGAEGMPFSIGNHITLKFPFNKAGRCGRCGMLMLLYMLHMIEMMLLH